MRSLGIILVFIGFILLLKQFRPDFLVWLEPYAGYIKSAFWGVTLIALGLHILAKNKALKALILVLYLLYLAIYLVM